ncbi:putative iron-sulfur cluster-binding metallochaperone [Deinococcus arcticus]|uniref:(2Fe-2S)-binding protein n=1 Tax=Deinococcus arcticus TaxID=2136176 RepID=A0A2T3W4D8_9DEIO|nr:copper chaperone Copz family protein [Deinococcus arcticus]PTA66766.1 (2Fe-2S)-binding protein [Deinococcus arcticus]
MNALLPPCPLNGKSGKVVKLITLKALLTPQALTRLTPVETYHFCSDPECPVVYYSVLHSFRIDDIKVPVFQKDSDSEVPVCYCFAYSRRALASSVKEDAGQIPNVIREHIQANRCGCEVNNPQGSCCLGNVTRLINAACEVQHT